MVDVEPKPLSLVCTVPHLPRRELNPNARGHWSKLRKAKAEARDEMVAELLQQGCVQSPLWEKAHLDIVFRAKDKRRRDLDNLIASCKAYIDGMVGAPGVLVDDSYDRLSISARYEIGDEEQTVYTITRMADEG